MRPTLSLERVLLNRGVAGLLPLLSAIGCGGGESLTEPRGPAPVATVLVTPATGTVAVGQTLQLTAETRAADGAVLLGRPVTWATSDEDLAEVSGTGLVTGVAPGPVTISATSEGQSGTAAIAVTGASGVPVASVIVTPASASIAVGETVRLTAQPRAADGSPLAGRLVAWASSDEEVATVDGSGLVLGAAAGSATIAATSEGVEGTATVTVTGSGAEVASVTAGYFHTCALTIAGKASCWGFNNVGALGDGSTTDRHVPVSVIGGLTFAQLSGGEGYTCGLTVDGVAHCWGFSRVLGDGSSTSRSQPGPVAGGLTFASIATGRGHACALTVAGEAYCWGFNDFGQLGDGSGTFHQPTPVPVTGGLTFAKISAGAGHTCGVTPSGDAYCWGSDFFGELGSGFGHTVPFPVSGNLKFVQVSAGTAHTCGVTTAGSAYCWGRNAHGELGDGTTADSDVPVPVTGGLSFVQVSAVGEFHTCGVTTDQTAWCWGYSEFGQVGTGSTNDQLEPVPVNGGSPFISVSIGDSHSCGLDPDRVVYCWGYNGQGELGDGTTESRSLPVEVTIP